MEIRVHNLNKIYKKKGKLLHILKDFNYTFQNGKLYLIKGESGKGKTTLLTLLALLQKETSGEIYFNNELVSSLDNEKKCKIRRQDIGIVYQDYNLFNGLTVQDNVILADVCAKLLSKKEALAKITDILKLLNIDHRINHFPFELSGGEQQRVGIARAIFKNPSLLICDEPVSNLDPENSKRIIDFLDKYCHENNKIVIVTSHNEYFDECADQIINL